MGLADHRLRRCVHRVRRRNLLLAARRRRLDRPGAVRIRGRRERRPGAEHRRLGVEGSFIAQPSPQGATGTWISASRLEPGTVLLSVTTSGPAKTFTVRPASAPDPPAYFDPLSCAVKAAPSAPAAGNFTVASRATYDAVSKGWRLAVTLASAGRVRAVQPEPTVGTAAPTSSTAKPLVQSRSVALKSPGRVTLELRPTPRGQSKLSATGSLKLKLFVTFFPAGGTAASKVVTLVLKK